MPFMCVRGVGITQFPGDCGYAVKEAGGYAEQPCAVFKGSISTS